MEVLVSATLLVTMIGVTAPLTVQMNRLWKDAQSYRMAEHEVANQLERLLSLSESEREGELKSLVVSKELLAKFPNAKLTSQVISNGDGTAVTLRLEWGTKVERTPLEMTAWLNAMPVIEANVNPAEGVAP